jgi:osmoprotectant transport system permease protein
VSELLRGVVPLLTSHLEISLVALLLAAAISLPLAVAAASRPRLAGLVVTIASVIQTIPGLALLALMVPLLAMTGWLSPFGFPPAVIALTLYAILPILRNAVTGLRGVDAAVVEAARGMGMASWQIMRRVQLPLAAPVIAAGIRTAAVWTVGMATLATPVGQTCLGNYIFTGLQTRNFAMLLVGVAAAAALALTLDALLAAAEHALAGRARRRALFPVALLALLVVMVVGVLPQFAISTRAPIAAATRMALTQQAVTHVRVGGKTFTEQYVLVALLRLRLEAAGIGVDTAQSLGSTVIFDALVNGDIDAYVDYSGTLWSNTMKRASGTARWQVLKEVEGWLAHEHRVRSLGSLGFENAYSLAMRRDNALRLGLRSLGDLGKHAGTLSIGGDYEFFGRDEWAALRLAYRPRFKRMVTFDPTLLYEAVTRGEVDAISAYSSDGRIAANDLVVLDDLAGALPPYDAMILLGPRVASDRRMLCALGGLHITLAAMQHANAMVDRDKLAPAVAAAWLLEQQGPGAADCRQLVP